MSRDELQELAALYAVDLLEGEELLAFERELAINPEARLAVERFTATSDVLALTAEEVEPPADLEDRIFSEIDSSEASASRPGLIPMHIPPESPDTRASRSFSSWFPWGIAAAFAVTSLIFWVQRSEVADRFETLQSEYSEKVDALLSEHSREVNNLEASFTQRVESLLAEHSQELNSLEAEVEKLESQGALQNLRIAVLKSQLESAPNAQAVAVWNASRQTGRLTVSELPALSEDQDYQLWIIDPAYESPVSAGVFNTSDAGTLEYSFSGSESISTINAFALSLESKGGNASPQGPIVLVGN
ncbi:anti-sigma factor [Pelagicoccus enzymogenes]|uniref:anti-sigma factor n=1 Tax=Pelagicoccus enzymogenes TaxID=2773457 RepID=UPI00280FD0B3|nr:anti-sigma factor [Pelagicoccus enzymogenes]MDQ8200343.1 anti-sigma factor [Pelagicoccus enzymogenes]